MTDDEFMFWYNEKKNGVYFRDILNLTNWELKPLMYVLRRTGYGVYIAGIKRELVRRGFTLWSVL